MLRLFFNSLLVRVQRGGLNTEHWNIEHIGIPKVLKFGFLIVRIGRNFVWFSNGLDHWKTYFLIGLWQKREKETLIFQVFCYLNLSSEKVIIFERKRKRYALKQGCHKIPLQPHNTQYFYRYFM